MSLVFLDLDGVLNEFFEAAFRWFNVVPKAIDEYDIINLINKNGGLSLDPDEFWLRTNAEFWISIPKSKDHAFWLAEAKRLGEVIILTKTVNYPGCVEGKIKWIRRYLPDADYLLGNIDKSKLARPGTLLIDDCRKNVDDFCKAGGQGVLVPRTWNE